MKYKVLHKTTYSYAASVPLSHNQVRVYPRSLQCQQIIQTVVNVEPKPMTRRLWTDPFGNTAEFFSIEHNHTVMSVTAESLIERTPPILPPVNSLNQAGNTSRYWRDIVNQVAYPSYSQDRFASLFQYDSKYAYRSNEIRKYADVSLENNADITSAARDLCRRIFDDFKYKSSSTTIDTPLAELLKTRTGVCQDFAHLMIAALRCYRIPARYVSGYMSTVPPPGQVKLVGSDASHAWVSVYVGSGTWIDYDPTNDLIVGDQHITLAWGRDFADVSPIQGIVVGGGAAKLSVSVDVAKIV